MAWPTTSRHARGYGSRWDKLRLHILARDPVCTCDRCKKDGVVRLSTEVDHVISKAAWLKKHGKLIGVDDPSNLRGMDSDCHERKTLAETGKAPRVGFDAQGNPIDD